MNKLVKIAVLSFFAFLFFQSANAQSYTQAEQNCFNLVQNKVAYDKEGNKTWSEVNIRNLCKGTSNPAATISCFTNVINNFNDWNRGIRECAGAGANNSNAVQTSASLEQNCFNLVQGKVAYDRAGNKQWSESNIRNLCRGTTNPSQTIACFQNEISKLDDWARAIKACQVPEEREGKKLVEKPAASQTGNIRTVTFKNNAHIQAVLGVGAASSGVLNIGESKIVNITEAPGTPLLITVTMKLPDPTNFTIYQGTIAGTNGASSFCFEAKGDVLKPSVAPCDGTPAIEGRKIEFRNEAGFLVKPTLNYFAGGVAKSVSSENTSVGMTRVLYIPPDADQNRDITLVADYLRDSGWKRLSESKIDRNSGSSACYKVWGGIGSPKFGACSISSSARTIKFKNMGAFIAKLEAFYYDQFQQTNNIATNPTALLETDVIEIPRGAAARPIKITLLANTDAGSNQKVFYTTTVPANFTGEVCFKAEGTIFQPTGSTCDDTLGDTSGETRQIKFQNDGAYDAEATVMYFEYQTVGGNKISMPKTITTGFINLGKSRMITVPKDVVPGTTITIHLRGNATVKGNDAIFTATLPADFAGSPVPCFKVWGSLFNPSGGECNQ